MSRQWVAEVVDILRRAGANRDQRCWLGGYYLLQEEARRGPGYVDVGQVRRLQAQVQGFYGAGTDGLFEEDEDAGRRVAERGRMSGFLYAARQVGGFVGDLRAVIWW